jgi:hypothetical protein
MCSVPQRYSREGHPEEIIMHCGHSAVNCNKPLTEGAGMDFSWWGSQGLKGSTNACLVGGGGGSHSGLVVPLLSFPVFCFPWPFPCSSRAPLGSNLSILVLRLLTAFSKVVICAEGLVSGFT